MPNFSAKISPSHTCRRAFPRLCDRGIPSFASGSRTRIQPEVDLVFILAPPPRFFSCRNEFSQLGVVFANVFQRQFRLPLAFAIEICSLAWRSFSASGSPWGTFSASTIASAASMSR